MGKVRVRRGGRSAKAVPRGKAQAAQSRPRRSLLSGFLKISLGLCLLASISGGMALGAAMAYYSMTMPDPLRAGLDRQASSVTILAADGTKLSARGARRDRITIETLPKHVVHAVLATEDRRFFHHVGVDPFGLGRAIVTNVKAGRYVQGGSTITQQLVKNLFLKPERTMHRKVQEMLLSLWLEMRLEKEQILELYLNHVYFGGGAHGIEAAARRYFGVSATDLTLAQSAMLAGLLKAPSKYAPTRNMRRARGRSRIVLKRMVDENAITPSQARRAQRERIHIRPDNSYRKTTGSEYASDWVMERVGTLVGSTSDDIIVETTIDRYLQHDAQRIVTRFMRKRGQPARAGQAAAIVMGPKGGVRAVVGGRSYRRSQFNRAIKAKRQPGSAFKPFIFLSALENGLSPQTIAYDEPVSIGGWSPKNYSKRYRGAVTLQDAFAHSINSVAVRLYMDVGRWNVVRIARRLGIQSDLHRKPSLALGTAEVTLAELTGAYVPFANGGRGVDAHIIRKIRTRDGRVLYARRASGAGRVVKKRQVALINRMMRATVSSGTGRRARFGNHDLGGKTGTSQESRDAWFVGYSRYLVGGVWIGNDTGRRMNKVTGSTMPAELWRTIMVRAHRGLSRRPLYGLTLPVVRKPVVRPVRAPRQDALAALIARTEAGAARPAARVLPREPKPEPNGVTRLLNSIFGG